MAMVETLVCRSPNRPCSPESITCCHRYYIIIPLVLAYKNSCLTLQSYVVKLLCLEQFTSSYLYSTDPHTALFSYELFPRGCRTGSVKDSVCCLPQRHKEYNSRYTVTHILGFVFTMAQTKSKEKDWVLGLYKV